MTEKERSDDARFDLLFQRVQLTCKLKPDKWKKMNNDDTMRRALTTFLDHPMNTELCIYLNQRDELCCSLVPPQGFRRKAIFLLKKRQVDINVNNINKEIILCDVWRQPLEQLNLLLEEVCLPILKNKQNTSNWPTALAKDLMRHFYQMSGQTSVLLGRTEGKTLLPLPPAAADISNVDAAARDKAIVHSIESAVIDWTRQIKEVVSSDPESPVKDGGHPGPMVELDFWNSKASNLQSIYDQLCDERIRKVMKVLEVTRSSYYPALKRIMQEVVAALTEANDNKKFLYPLRGYFDQLSQDSNFENLNNLYKPILHIISLIWTHSNYYNTPARMVVLLKEICNDIILQARRHVNAESLFASEPPEAVAKLTEVLDSCSNFKKIFFEYKARVNSQNPDHPWRFENSAIFERLDQFIERLHDLVDLMKTIVEFDRIEKLDVGGTKGRLLSTQLTNIYMEFKTAVKAFSEVRYDMLDIDSRLFDNDFNGFRNSMKDMERRIGNILIQAFDDCGCVQNMLKLVDGFEGLLMREIIQQDFNKKYFGLLQAFNEELIEIRRIFDAGKSSPPIHDNMPIVAGTLSWIHGLMARIKEPMEKILYFRETRSGLEDIAFVKDRYDMITHDLIQYQQQLYVKWSADIDQDSQSKLNLPLLRRQEDTFLIGLNFDQELIALLREAKYFHLLGFDLPAPAMRVYEHNDKFQFYTTSLDVIIQKYNNIVKTLLTVEQPLVQSRLEVLDRQLEKGLTTLTWNSDGIPEYIRETLECVSDVSDRLGAIKANVKEIEKILNQWAATPLLERRDPRRLVNFEEEVSKMSVRHNDIREGGKVIHQKVLESSQILEASKSSNSWKGYLQYLTEIIIRGFYKVVKNSMGYLLQLMEPQAVEGDVNPLLEAKLELISPEIVFTPKMDNIKGGLRDIFEDVIDGFFASAKMMPRLDSDGDYLQDVLEDDELLQQKDRLMQTVQYTIAKCNSYRRKFLNYEFLWKEDIQEYLQRFLKTSDLTGDQARAPVLADFESRITRFQNMKDTLESMQGTILFGWVRVDARPLKNSLIFLAGKWIQSFTQHLYEDVVSEISDLSSFIGKVTQGLAEEVTQGDYEALVRCMGHVHSIRIRLDTTDAQFEPMRQAVGVLKKFGIKIPNEIIQELEEIPQRWMDTKKLMFNSKDRLAPLQTEELAKIRKHVENFDDRATHFRETFSKSAPYAFKVGARNAFKQIDKLNQQLSLLEKEAKELQEKEDLFEIPVHEYKVLGQMRTELNMAKEIWDIIDLVTFQFNEWNQTKWAHIQTEFIEDETKKFIKTYRNLDRAIRSWDAYNGLDGYVKNLLTSLPLISDLRSPAMRDRHWKQLMKATNKHFDINENFKLEDLLNLELHKFVDEVSEIVDRADKELKISKALTDLENSWASFTFEFSRTKDNTPLLKPMEELTEALDNGQNMLQTLLTSKYVAHFYDDINNWQQQLANVESILTTWLQVQHTWAHLETIFIGSPDIRTQLPEDSKRFDGIDADFRDLMRSAEATPNVLEACAKDGMYAALEKLQRELSLCEKSLADYLETKRLAFPRFYFISPANLVEILSRGTRPDLVAPHLSKIFDDVNGLKFQTDAEGNPTPIALGMYSKEDEYVEFLQPCNLTGPVESWLNRLLLMIRRTLRNILNEAIVTYEEKPREQWLFDFPAQIALVATQIWWTTEVNIAFERMEEGNETALKDYNKKQQDQLNKLIQLLIGELTQNDRQKIMTICTMDVHARDIIAKLIQERVEDASAFGWKSQLRFRWDEKAKPISSFHKDAAEQGGHEDKGGDCCIGIADAEFRYWYEYLGNTPRLVVTPLTDRCYITLTQALHHKMGGAPAGPAGTGKTETTKDLGRALGMMVYVFNCSEQMDYKVLGQIFKGLSQSGTWGCFDEFNRIAIEVLSVVSTQVKSIFDAIRGNKERFLFQGEEIPLNPTVGIFITMNPGYAGRTELPESIKALFRAVSMVVPDLLLICENMLIAEGIMDAKNLAKKFTTLYALCKELLSKQDHYDWGLRSIKSLLVVVGSFKRAEPEMNEEDILMRALRDSNLPKIVVDDVQIFLGLIKDLFPNSAGLARKRNVPLEEAIRKVILQNGLQPEENFILKICQLSDLLAVRHSVFVLGPPGCGKTKCWSILAKTMTSLGKKTIVNDLNPKAVSADDLYGYMNKVSREWKDGLLSSIMRNLSEMPGDDAKWIILDGDIDPGWIETMNTVMDDNKVLTLANNERIPLRPSMRMIFEIGNLKNATPATVSRAGILYINEIDVGWNPYVQSWIDKRENMSERSTLVVLFDKYIPPILDHIRKNYKLVVPVVDISMVQTLCNLFESLLISGQVPPGSDKDIYETYLTFAAVWAFGGALFYDLNEDHRSKFSKWWRTEWKTSPAKFPVAGSIFDYYIDHKTRKFVHWAESLPAYTFNRDLPLQSVIVPTVETARLGYLIDLLLDIKKPVLLVGPAGSGKTSLVRMKIRTQVQDRLAVSINFNYFTDARSLQEVMEQSLEKKSGRMFGPPGRKRLVYFIDDLNMPMLDQYGIQSPSTLLRQYLDYNHWYDREKMTIKEISNIQFISCMNPTAGSFTIDPRLQRHYTVFNVSFPEKENLQVIFEKFLGGHLEDFLPVVRNACNKVVQAALDLHRKVCQTFPPTAVKFHYNFNLRDMTNIFQSLMLATPTNLNTSLKLFRLWIHEAYRVYSDRLIGDTDMPEFRECIAEVSKRFYDEHSKEKVLAEPIIFSTFAKGVGDMVYDEITDVSKMKQTLEEALNEYNEVNPIMNLVLFDDAMSHVNRICRILQMPRGNALLVGVGGSGKQSLARLAAFISRYEVFQVSIRRSYGMNDLRVDLQGLYNKAGIRNVPMILLLTDSHILEEKFLVYINDLLCSGYIPDLYAAEEREAVISGVRNDVKQAGLGDSRDVCWEFFVNRVRQNLRVVMCMSPVGETLRVRARHFPSIVTQASIDWFHPWPHQALLSVAARFLADTDFGSKPNLRENIAEFMAYVHQSVNDAGVEYLQKERRYVYTTPKSFLELIDLYKSMLDVRRSKTNQTIGELQGGLKKLAEAARDVSALEEELKKKKVVVDQRQKAADALLVRVGKETTIVEGEKKLADEEETRLREVAEQVSQKQAECLQDLAAAEPALQAAENALKTLNKNNLTELKSFANPSQDVQNVMSAVNILLSPPKNIKKSISWNEAKKMMANVDRFLVQLIEYDKDHINPVNLQAIQPYMADPTFNAAAIKIKSQAAGGICDWVRNVVEYYNIFSIVQPKRDALAEATAQMEQSQASLDSKRAQLETLNGKLRQLTMQFEKATEEKNLVMADAEKTELRLTLANSLIKGLGSENIRWEASITRLKAEAETIPGDVLLCASFMSYLGGFNKTFRNMLIQDKWLPFLQSKTISITPNIDPVTVVTDEADVATWNNEGLPADLVSIQNASIISNCRRWPLIIDPQMQAIVWIKNHEASHNLQVIRMNQPRFLEIMERAIESGESVLVEGVGEFLDPVLEPILARNVFRKGRSLYIKLGDKDVEYDPRFKLFLQTKLSNPHFKPEIQAQSTLVNFTVTEDGLEDQLLAMVVNRERPDLEIKKTDLRRQRNEFKIRLKQLEDNLLTRLSQSEGDILADTELIQNLQNTKLTSSEIQEKAIQAQQMEEDINKARENYRPVAARASLLYFLLNEIWKVDAMYQYSLKAFVTVFNTAIDTTPLNEDVGKRIDDLITTITYNTFRYVSRGLFSRHKLVFAAQLCFAIMKKKGEIPLEEFDYLVRGPQKLFDLPNPMHDWLPSTCWQALLALQELSEFSGIAADVESSAKRWKKLYEHETPEKEKLPQEWKSKSDFQRLLILRALRPDRMTQSIAEFVREKLGKEYIDFVPFSLEATMKETSPAIPTFFILSPGADPLKEVEALGKKLNYTEANGKFKYISLGQGQEPVADHYVESLCDTGGWVMLQNIHLTASWLPTLEKRIEALADGSIHPDFRLFLSAEPSPTPDKAIPPGILQACIKITNEPPQGIQANMSRALACFSQEQFEQSAKENEYKTILFALCFFHAVVLERRKFGAQGWNKTYTFNEGDLTISAKVLLNYLDNPNNVNVPWDDLRYIFGEIMYGGHISDEWDRRLCRTYLEVIMNNSLFEGGDLAPGFPCPPAESYQYYVRYINEHLPSETPYMFGLHPNAEIGFLTAETGTLFRTILDLQPRQASSGEMPRDERVRMVVDDFTDRMPELFDMAELYGRVDEFTPFVTVCLQECDRMNILVRGMKRSLAELDLGLKGELTISDQMDALMDALYMDRVPAVWEKLAYPSLKTLALWFADVLSRVHQLQQWTTGEINLPNSVWISGLFNPQSFLTAIMQATARRNEWPLDRMCLVTEVTKKNAEDVEGPPRDGAYIHGLFLEGARWDMAANVLAESHMKELYSQVPVLYLKAVTLDKQDLSKTYACPVYKTVQRGPTFVWTFNLRTNEPDHVWVRRGVALIMSV